MRLVAPAPSNPVPPPTAVDAVEVLSNEGDDVLHPTATDEPEDPGVEPAATGEHDAQALPAPEEDVDRQTRVQALAEQTFGQVTSAAETCQETAGMPPAFEETMRL